jgi:CHRD domain
MSLRRFVAMLALVAFGAVVLAGPVLAATLDGAKQGGRLLSTTLTGAEEVNAQGVPNQGDPDGSGFATLIVNPGQEEICYELSASGIAPATAAHIHFAPAGQNGPIVVPLEPPTDGTSADCASVDRALAKEILKNPELYYVNVHNDPFPNGALRGQLSK